MMKRTLFIAAGALLSLNFWCQEWSLKLSSNVEIRTWKLTSTYEKEEKSLQGAKIVLTKAGSVVNETSTDGSGDFTIMVPADGDFLLTVSYPGYNTKRFSVNTTGVPKDFNKDNNWKPSFSIGGFIMARAFPGVNYSALEQPLLKVEWMPKKKVFDNDVTMTNNGIQNVGNITAAENALIQKFCGLNKQGDVALAKPDCPLAKKLYQEATALIPFETYPVLQLQKVGECLKDQSEAQAKAAEEAAKKAAAEKAAAEKAAADKLAANKAAADKAAADKAAAEQKAAEQKAANAKAQAEADAAAKAKADAKAEEERKKKEGLAASKAEDEAAAKADEEKRKQKEKERAEAEAKATAEELANAKAKAEEKKEKERKQKEGMAKAKAEDEAEAKAIAEKKAAERKAKEDEERLKYETKSSDPEGEMGKGNGKVSVPQTVFGVDKYKTAIKRADELFKMKRWSEAKTAYEEALSIKKDDPYAISKLEIVNKNLAPK